MTKAAGCGIMKSVDYIINERGIFIMKKILTTMAVAAVVLTAACGCGKKSAPVETTEAPKTAGEFVIPDNWDGVTFKSEENGITIIAPEEGWECTKNDEKNLIINKGEESVSYGEADIKNPDNEPKDEATIKKRIGKNYDISDFDISKDDSGKITYEYVAATKEELEMDKVKYVITTVDGDIRITSTAITQAGNEERLEELKKVVKENIKVEK